MNAELTPAMAFDTISLNIPKTDLSFFKTLAKKMGWVINKKSTPRKKRLYDPETGEYLNDETMKAIEDDSVAFSGSFEDFKKWAQNL